MKKCILLYLGVCLYFVGLQAQLSTEALILNAQEVNADFVEVNHATFQVFLHMPYGYDIRALAPTFQISPQATISPASGSTMNFISPVSYTVTAQDGITKNTYSVEVFVPTIILSRRISAGWNWISLSAVPSDLNVSSVLGSLPLTNLDYIKSVTASAVYYTSIGWFGELSNLPQYEMLFFKIAAESGLTNPPHIYFRLTGKEINPTITTIPVSQGWNRLGFILKGNIQLSKAFESSTLPPGVILLKSKEASAIYYPGSGWAGDLDSLRILTGYMMKTTTSGAIKYNASSARLDQVTQSVFPRKELYYDHRIDPLEYQNSANLIGELVDQNGEYVTRKGDILIASSQTETRGVSEAIFVPELNRYIFLLTMFSNLDQEKLSFSIKSLSDDREKALSNELLFVTDEVHGLAMNPLKLQLSGSTKTADVSNERSISVYQSTLLINKSDY
jgi:hypothetical protein